MKLLRLVLSLAATVLIFFFGQRAYTQVRSHALAVATLQKVLHEPDTANKLFLLKYLSSLDPGNAALQDRVAEIEQYFDQRVELDRTTRELADARAEFVREKNASQKKQNELKSRIRELEGKVSELRKTIRIKEKIIVVPGCGDEVRVPAAPKARQSMTDDYEDSYVR